MRSPIKRTSQEVFMRLIHAVLIIMLSALVASFQSPLTVNANVTQSIRLSSTSVQTGQRARIFVQAQNLNGIEAFQFQIFYDETQLTVARQFTYSYLSSRGTAVINTSEDGVISVSYVGTIPLSGSSNLFYFDFDVSSDAKIQSNPLIIGIQEALGDNFEPVQLMGVRGNIDVTERSASLRNAPVSISTSHSRVQEGDTFTMSLNLNHSVLKSAGSFDIFYDDQILQLKSSTIDNISGNSETLAMVNDQFRGKVHFNFISLKGLNSVWPILTLEFEVIQDVQAQTNIQVVPLQILDMDLIPLQTVNNTRSIQVNKKPQVLNIPSVFIESKTLTQISDFSVDLNIEANSQLAAGVFEIEYNPFLIELVEFEILGSDVSSNVLTTQTLLPEEGLAQLTYLNPEGLTGAESIARLHFRPLRDDEPIHTQISVRLKQALNANFQGIVLAEQFGQIDLSNQYHVKVIHNGQEVQSETTDNLNTIILPSIDIPSGHRFADWEVIVQGQNITYRSLFYKLGDINENGTVDESDLELLRNALVGKTQLSKMQLRASNMLERDSINNQSELTLKDLVLLELAIALEANSNED